jgi:putative Mg2+ transporter-C (MgtC) family protein
MNTEGGTMLSTHVEIMESLGRLGVALALGSVIGFERQWRQKIAGLRTNALVALGSCGFVVFSAMVGEGDPTRVAAQVVTGIGFLCAGTILREGINVHGLNTAATLWCCAMVGTFAGAGFWAPSLVATGFVVGTNLLLRPPVRLINTENISTAHAETFYSVTLTCKSVEEAHLRLLLLHALSQGEFGVRCIDSSDIPDTSNVAVTAQVAVANRNDAAVEQIVGWLSLEPRVSAVAWQMDWAIPEAQATGSGFPKHNSWNSRLVSGVVSGSICGGGARTIR